MQKRYLWSALLAGLFLFSGIVWAKDFEQARALLEKGEILSLSDILARVSSKVPGKLLEIGLEEKEGKVVYEIEFLAENGVVMEMLIDAKAGNVISVKED